MPTVLTEVTTADVSGIVSEVGDVVTGAISWINSFLGVITGNSLLLIFCILGIVGIGVGFVKRLLSVN